MALAKVGGGVDSLSTPIGKVAGVLLATVCYLAVGPLFATPRTATVSFEVGIALAHGRLRAAAAFIHSRGSIFAVVILVSLYPGKLLDTVGNFLAPLKIIAAGRPGGRRHRLASGPDQRRPTGGVSKRLPFSNGFVNGYLTMDTLGAMVFGIVIVNAARRCAAPYRSASADPLYRLGWPDGGRRPDPGWYLALFRLGSDSAYARGSSPPTVRLFCTPTCSTPSAVAGSFLLAALIFIACLVTAAVGLTCACAEFFAQYRAALLPHAGLCPRRASRSRCLTSVWASDLIQVSDYRCLTAIHPPCIALVVLSFTRSVGGIIRPA